MKNRKDQIEEEAMNFAKPETWLNSSGQGFIVGAEWADNHPDPVRFPCHQCAHLEDRIKELEAGLKVKTGSKPVVDLEVKK